jgi:hypothetical protein
MVMMKTITKVAAAARRTGTLCNGLSIINHKMDKGIFDDCHCRRKQQTTNKFISVYYAYRSKFHSSTCSVCTPAFTLVQQKKSVFPSYWLAISFTAVLIAFAHDSLRFSHVLWTCCVEPIMTSAEGKKYRGLPPYTMRRLSIVSV